MSLTVRDVTEKSRCRGCRLDQMLTCSVCNDRYREPLMFPCQHSFCKSPCFAGLVKDAKPGDLLQCPECNNKYPVPEQGLEGYPVNDTINTLLGVSKKDFNQYVNDTKEKNWARAKGFRPQSESKLAELRRKHYMRKKQREACVDKVNEKGDTEPTNPSSNRFDDPVNFPGIKGSCSEKHCEDCGKTIIHVKVDDASSSTSANSEMDKENGYNDPPDEQNDTTSKSKRSAKRQRQKAKAKAVQVTKDVPKTREDHTTSNGTSTATSDWTTTTPENKNGNATKGREKRMIKIMVEGRPMFMLRCPVCHNRPVEGMCVHCKQRVCVQCLEEHLKPMVITAVKVLQQYTDNSLNPHSPLGEGFQLYASESNTEDRFTSLSDSVKYAIYKYTTARNSVCDSGLCSKGKHTRDTINPEIAWPDTSFVETPVKEDALSVMALNLLRDNLNKDENMFYDFVTNYMTLQVIPYEAHLIVNTILRANIEEFQTRAQAQLDRPLGKVPIDELVDVQGECHRYSCMFAQLQAGQPEAPSLIKIEKRLIDIILEKIRYVRYEKALYSAALDNQILLIEKLKTLRFVKIYGDSEAPELTTVSSYRYFGSNITVSEPEPCDNTPENDTNKGTAEAGGSDNSGKDGKDLPPVFDDSDSGEPVYLIDGDKKILQPHIRRKKGTQRIHHLIMQNVKGLQKPEHMKFQERFPPSEKTAPPVIEPDVRSKEMTESSPVLENRAAQTIDEEGVEQGTGSTFPKIFMSPNTDFTDPKVQECIRNLPEMVSKMNQERAAQEQVRANGGKKKHGGTKVVVENNSYRMFEYNLGHFEGDKFIPAPSDSDDELSTDPKRKGKTKKVKGKKSSPKRKEQIKEKRNDKAAQAKQPSEDSHVVSDVKETNEMSSNQTEDAKIANGFDKHDKTSDPDEETDPITMSQIWEIINCVD